MPDRASNTLDLLQFQLAYLSHAHVLPPAEPLLNFYDVAHTGFGFSVNGLFCGQLNERLPLINFSFFRLCLKHGEEMMSLCYSEKTLGH